MKYCKYCGNRIDENAIFCPSCGARVSGDNPHVNNNPFNNMYGPNAYAPVYDTKGSLLIAIVSFLCWEAGAIIWFLWRYTHPGKARSALKGALANVSLGMPVLGFILWLVLREEEARRDYAKVCGIAAIVGGAFYVLTLVLVVVLTLTGVIDEGFYSSLPLGEMMATVVGFLR